MLESPVLHAGKDQVSLSQMAAFLLYAFMAHTHTHTQTERQREKDREREGGRERWLGCSLFLFLRAVITSWGLYHHDLIYSELPPKGPIPKYHVIDD